MLGVLDVFHIQIQDFNLCVAVCSLRKLLCRVYDYFIPLYCLVNRTFDCSQDTVMRSFEVTYLAIVPGDCEVGRVKKQALKDIFRSELFGTPVTPNVDGY